MLMIIFKNVSDWPSSENIEKYSLQKLKKRFTPLRDCDKTRWQVVNNGILQRSQKTCIIG